jgi:hypothetical protein
MIMSGACAFWGPPLTFVGLVQLSSISSTSPSQTTTTSSFLAIPKRCALTRGAIYVPRLIGSPRAAPAPLPARPRTKLATCPRPPSSPY